MNRPRIIIITAGLLVLALLVSAVWWLINRPSAPVPAGNNQPATTSAPLVIPGFISSSAAVLPPAQLTAVVAARVWAERFASWSNEDNFSNLAVLALQATGQVKTFLQQYQRQLADKYPLAAGYYGVTGRALSPQLVSFNDAAATVAVQMQLEESSSSSQPVITNRTLELRLIKNSQAAGPGSEQWLVDFLKWQTGS